MAKKVSDATYTQMQELGENARTEDILKVMEAVGGVALKLKLDDKLSGPFGFNKKKKGTDEGGTSSD